MSITQQVIEQLETLPAEKQQEVLDFVEFLQSRLPEAEESQHQAHPISALEAAGDLVGCVKGEPIDLSTNRSDVDEFEAIANQLADEFTEIVRATATVLPDEAFSRAGIYQEHP